MADGSSPRWLEWAREIQALAQTGYYYSENHYQKERYQRLTEIAAEIFSEQAGLDYEPLLAVFRAQSGYATPRVDVRAAVFNAGKLLLVCERSDGGWTMPGGWADVGDVPSQAAEREAWEEAGFRVKAHMLVGVYDNNRIEPLDLFHCFKLVFLCDLLSGEASPSLETSEVGFFALDEIPQQLSGQRTGLRQIQDAFNASRNPLCPTVFD
jgi:ADP-ribose pyrophosphatase YjhB (NUDIX family)